MTVLLTASSGERGSLELKSQWGTIRLLADYGAHRV